MAKDFDLGKKTLSPGVYLIKITKQLQITMHSTDTVEEAACLVNAMLLGNLTEFSIELKPDEQAKSD